MFQRKIESIQFLVHILKPNSNMIFFSKRQQLDKMLTTNIRYGYFEMVIERILIVSMAQFQKSMTCGKPNVNVHMIIHIVKMIINSSVSFPWQFILMIHFSINRVAFFFSSRAVVALARKISTCEISVLNCWQTPENVAWIREYHKIITNMNTCQSIRAHGKNCIFTNIEMYGRIFTRG